MTGQDRGQECLAGVDPTEGRGRDLLGPDQPVSCLPVEDLRPDLPPPAWSRGFTYQYQGDTDAT